VQRLDRLNGSVARHEADLNAVKIDQARREGADANSGRWFENLKPAIWTVLGVIGVLVLEHGHALVAAFTSLSR
jgi:hypothetical protein